MVKIWSDTHPEYEARKIAMDIAFMLWMEQDIPLTLV